MPRTHSLLLSMSGGLAGAVWKTAPDTAASKPLTLASPRARSLPSFGTPRATPPPREALPATALAARRGSSGAEEESEDSSARSWSAIPNAPPRSALPLKAPGSTTRRRGANRERLSMVVSLTTEQEEETVVRFCDDAERHFLHRAVELEAEVKALQYELRQVRLSTRQIALAKPKEAREHYTRLRIHDTLTETLWNSLEAARQGIAPFAVDSETYDVRRAAEDPDSPRPRCPPLIAIRVSYECHPSAI